MRAVLVSVLVLLTAACGAYRYPGQSPAGTGTVSGQVTAVPCSPVEVPDQPCAGRPVSGLEIDFSAGGTTIGTQTGPKGGYAVELAAGTWKVSINGIKIPIISGPQAVTVEADLSAFVALLPGPGGQLDRITALGAGLRTY